MVAVLAAAGYSLLAQTPAAAPAPAGEATAAPAQGRGAGGRGVLPADPAAGRGASSVQRDSPANANADFSPKPPMAVKTPADEQKLFQLQTGFRIENVLADPHIQEPAAISFDGNGRMYVTELRTYMNDADGTDTLTPGGRISRHEDRDNDGVYETHTVFVDNMIFPRFAMPFGADAILTKNSHDPDVWKYTDTNGDGVADKKEFFATDFGRGGNVEHQESHLTWGMDNWLYSTYNAVRLRWTPRGVLRESSGSGGAWGVTQDNEGKIWLQGGASGLPGYYQLPIRYGNFTGQNQQDPELRTTWGAPVRIADMQPGMNNVRMPDGSLHSSTAGAGGDVYRGDRLPADMIGDYFYGEVVARIVRRVKAETREGVTYIRNYYPNSEFIRQTDPLFRPVDQATAPDGTMYIVDMYRGIIQESQWTPQGSYLRAKIDQYKLDKVTDHGRIWRLTYEGMGRDTTQPRMLNETPAQLVAHLSHPNGWWRDTAQQLLILKQDKSVVPALQQLVQSSSNQLARFHALWTLEGLDALNAALAAAAFRGPQPAHAHSGASRERDALQGRQPFVRRRLRCPCQGCRRGRGRPGDALGLRSEDAGRAGRHHGDARSESGGRRAAVRPADADQLRQRGGCRPHDSPAPRARRWRVGRPSTRSSATPATAATAAVRRRPAHRQGRRWRRRWRDRRGYGAPRLRDQGDHARPDRTARRRRVQRGHGTDGEQHRRVDCVGGLVHSQRFGNTASFVSTADVARVRAATRARRTQWTLPELMASLPVQLDNTTQWKATASHAPESARMGFMFGGWSSGVPQQPDMWFQVELPDAVMLTEIQFDSAGGGGGRGGGGGGRGAAVAAAAETAPAPAAPAPVPQAGFPQAYRVQVSTDGTTWSAPVAQGQGTGTETAINFTPVRARFVRITQTGAVANAPAWSILNMRLFTAPASPAPAR